MVSQVTPLQRPINVHAGVVRRHDDANFVEQQGGEAISEIADAASSLLVAIFRDAGRHPRSVLGVTQLPQSAPVLIELTLELCESQGGVAAGAPSVES